MKKQDDYPTARLTLKRWSKRNPTVEPHRTRPKTDHHAQTNFIECFQAVSITKSEADVLQKKHGQRASAKKRKLALERITERMHTSLTRGNHTRQVTEEQETRREKF